MDSTKTTSELETLRQKVRSTWNAGDYPEIAKAFENGAEEFVLRLDLTPGMAVLDVACGNGNTAIPAARLGAEVTGLDITPYLIERAVERAAAAKVNAEFDIGDAEAMPYDDACFDRVITMFGAMFTPRPEVVASELKRVTKPGGQIVMANWTPQGFIGQMFKIIGKYVTAPTGMQSPILWGDEDTVANRFAEGVELLRMTRRDIDFIFPYGPTQVVDTFLKYYGPTQKTFEALDAEGQASLRADLEKHWSDNNQANDGTTLVVSEYLEVTAIR